MDTCIIGGVILFAGTFVPDGYIECDGRSLQPSDYQPLYSIVGNHFGGDGKLFNIPKLDPPKGMLYIICFDGIYPSRP